MSLSPEEYANPERIARMLARLPQVESADIITGDWEIIAKIRTNNIEEYYQFVKSVLSVKGIAKTKSLSSMKTVKTEFIEME